MHMGRPTVANTRLSETNAPARARALASSYVVLLCPKRVGPAGGRDGLAIEEGADGPKLDTTHPYHILSI
jgi:hypothetical protein